LYKNLSKSDQDEVYNLLNQILWTKIKNYS
jgi:hypothetical protein